MCTQKMRALSYIGAEKITFLPKPDIQTYIQRTYISVYRVASLLKTEREEKLICEKLKRASFQKSKSCIFVYTRLICILIYICHIHNIDINKQTGKGNRREGKVKRDEVKLKWIR